MYVYIDKYFHMYHSTMYCIYNNIVRYREDNASLIYSTVSGIPYSVNKT